MTAPPPAGRYRWWQNLRAQLSLRERAALVGVSLLVGLLCATAMLLGGRSLDRIDESLYRTWLTWRNSRLGARDLGAAGQAVVLVTIDDATKQAWGWPLPRSVYSEITRRLLKAGADTVGFDILFESKGPDPEADADLGRTLSLKEVTFPYRLEVEGGRVVGVPPAQSLGLKVSPERTGFTAVPGAPNEVRGIWLKIQQGQEVHYAWPVVALALHENTTPEAVLAKVAATRFSSFVDGSPVEAWEAWVNLPGQGLEGQGRATNSGQHVLSALLTQISVADLLDIPEQDLPGMFGQSHFIAVVGVSVVGGVDTKNTLVGMVSGPEIQTCTIMNLILNNFLVPSRPIDEAAMVLLVALGLGVLAAGLQVRALLGAALLGSLALVGTNYLVLGAGGFSAGRLLPLAGPLLTLILATGCLAALQLWLARRHLHAETLQLAQEICPVVGPQDANRIALSEAGERQVTVLLVDLGPFVRYAKGRDAPSVISRMRDCAAAIAEAAHRFGGTVLDYQGPIVRVVFGVNERSRRRQQLAGCGAAAAVLLGVRNNEAREYLWPPVSLATGTWSSHPSRAGVTATALALLAGPGGHLRAAETTTREAGVDPADLEMIVAKVKDDPEWQVNDQVLAANLTAGDQLGPYHLDSFLGQGGMGRVFLATDPRLQRQVALKVVTGNVDPIQSQRFIKEARAVAKVQHAGIVNVFDVGTDPVYFLAMEYATGRDMDVILKETGTLPPARSRDLIVQILDALGVVHSSGIVHRDLKPSNVMVDAADNTKLMDFGLARFVEDETRLTKAGEIWGTPEYMAPESVDDEFGPVDHVTDLFAVATMLYECLTGRLPVRNSSVSTILYDLVFAEPTPPCEVDPKIPADLSAVCMKGLEKEKADRYQTAGEFAAALRACRL